MLSVRQAVLRVSSPVLERPDGLVQHVPAGPEFQKVSATPDFDVGTVDPGKCVIEYESVLPSRGRIKATPE